MAGGALPILRRDAVLGGLALAMSPLVPRATAAPQRAFGAIFPRNLSSYEDLVRRGVVEKAAALGINLIPAEYADPAQASSAVEALLAQTVQGVLVLARGEVEMFSKLLAPATNAGVPSVSIGSSAVGATASVVSDLAAAGRLQAQAATKLTGGEGRILYLAWPNAATRPAFDAAIPDFKVRVVEVFINSGTAEEIVEKTKLALSQGAPIKVIVTSSDYFALIAAKAIESTSALVMIVGLGGTPEGIAAVREGHIAATVDLRPIVQGSEAVDALNHAASDPKCPCYKSNCQNPPCPPTLVEPVVVGAS